ncbi:MAG: DUF3105 domain-containing protein [Dehalococcoidia bacterium]
MRHHLILATLVALPAAACSGGGDDHDATTTPLPAVRATATAALTPAQAAEADADPNLPGEYIDLPGIYGAPYPYGPPPPHQDGPIDYSAQGLPPAGGFHWGPSDGWTGACPPDPATAPLNCGPVPSGVYRQPWHAESLVHNMEHAGFVIWYNTDDQHVIDDIEAFATEQAAAGAMIVVTPYPDMTAGTVAITAWSRRDMFPVEEYDRSRLQTFIDAHLCRVDLEEFCSAQ